MGTPRKIKKPIHRAPYHPKGGRHGPRETRGPSPVRGEAYRLATEWLDDILARGTLTAGEDDGTTDQARSNRDRSADSKARVIA